jgi:tRNA nucleotidyltransferase (CCA-adding enzyme)
MIYFLVLLEGVDVEEVESVLDRLFISKRVKEDFLHLRAKIRETMYRLKKWLSSKRANSDLYFIMDTVSVEGALYLMARNPKEDLRKALSLYLSKLKDMELDIGGEDLRRMGLEPGPAFTEILQKIKAAMLDGVAEDREDQLALADELVAEHPNPGHGNRL